MSTTTNLSVIKGFPYQVRARANGKYDLTSNHTFTTDGESVSLSMTAYNGLDMSYSASYESADTLDFSNTVLPYKWQYSTALTTDKYCLMPTGQNYENIKISAPTLNPEISISGVTVDSNFIASAFTWSGYVMKTVAYSNANAFIVKFHTHTRQTTDSNNCTVVTGSISVAMTKNVIKFWNNTTSAWQSVFSDLTNDSDFWMKISIVSNEVVFSFSTDGINYTDYTTGYSAINNVDFSYIGNNPNLAPSWVRNTGSFDLKELKMLDAGGNVIFEGVTSPKETLPGCTYNFEDDGSAITLNCFVVNSDESIVLTPDNSYGTSRLLGTVSIPSHTAYEYDNGTWTEKE